jgi:hypothetical protein
LRKGIKRVRNIRRAPQICREQGAEGTRVVRSTTALPARSTLAVSATMSATRGALGRATRSGATRSGATRSTATTVEILVHFEELFTLGQGTCCVQSRGALRACTTVRVEGFGIILGCQRNRHLSILRGEKKRDP